MWGNIQSAVPFFNRTGRTISKAIGLKLSRTRDYLKQLVDEGILEIEGEYKNRKYKLSNKETI